MTDQQRERINSAFEREIGRSPVPPPWALALVAVLLAVVIVGTLVFAARAFHPRVTIPVNPHPSPSASPSTAALCAAPGSSYGLMMFADKLEMIGRIGCLGPSASVAASSVRNCADGLPAVLAPPVSASNDKVYYRDGDTKIRFITPAGQTGDVTTVPGGPTTVSFFSVSPDDMRIAVVVEDLSLASTIALRLYVEDLNGHGHHADIYSATIPEGHNGMALWPAGWHQGRLVLGVVLACSATRVYRPSAWHVVDAATADRLASIDTSSCYANLLPTSGGVACFDALGLSVGVYDWTGKLKATIPTSFEDLSHPPGVSPSGQSVFWIGPIGRGEQTNGLGTDSSPAMYPGAYGRYGCVWIDDSDILAPDAVIAFPSGEVTPLPASGECVGRFPGAL